MVLLFDGIKLSLQDFTLSHRNLVEVDSRRFVDFWKQQFRCLSIFELNYSAVDQQKYDKTTL